MVKKRYKFYVDPDPTRTKFLMDKKTGKLRGRRLAKKKERSDQILNIREKASGQVFGFLPSGKKRLIPVRGDSQKRGTLRRRI